MKLFLSAYFLLFVKYALCKDSFENLNHIKPQVDVKLQEDAVRKLIWRIIPGRISNFIVSVNESMRVDGKDKYQLLKLNSGKIKIIGSSGVAVASGFNHYLKYYCNCHISWEGSQLNLPVDLPDVNIEVTFNDRFRYYQNVCTTSYSFVWWDWKNWEKHIDWMALNSFNLVLASNGQEIIWERVFKKINLTYEEYSNYFTGPAFLSWNRMGNIRHFMGPLKFNWQKRSLLLQHQILQRMRDLGIVPVLPAFAGAVPRSFKRIFPKAKLQILPKWNKFEDEYCCPYLLDPTDQIFQTIGYLFMKELIKEFGTNHIYNCDTFNEMVPFTTDDEYLSKIGYGIYSAMEQVDEKAVWLLQGWLFVHETIYWTRNRVKAFLTSVPQGKIIVLDLQSEQLPQYDRFDSYFGQPYIWCMLHNFGGTLGMFGSSDIINERIYEARQMKGSTLIGTGLTPEGINQNYVIYDLMVEMAWRENPENLTNWFTSYASRRYGGCSEDAAKAWDIFRKTAYNYKGLTEMRGRFAINRSPRTKIQTWTWYDQCQFMEGWDLLLAASSKFGNNFLYLHDLVDVTRQVLQNFGDEFYNKLMSAFRNKKIVEFQKSSQKFLSIFKDMDDILGSHSSFLLGNWIKAAKSAANGEIEDEEQYVLNALNQITLWGPNGEIKDYANKQWSGIMLDYFQARWRFFLNQMNESLASNSSFIESRVAQEMFKNVEKPFACNWKVAYPDQPKGNSIEIAKRIRDKWRWRGFCRIQKPRKVESYDILEEKRSVNIILIE